VFCSMSVKTWVRGKLKRPEEGKGEVTPSLSPSDFQTSPSSGTLPSSSTTPSPVLLNTITTTTVVVTSSSNATSSGPSIFSENTTSPSSSTSSSLVNVTTNTTSRTALVDPITQTITTGFDSDGEMDDWDEDDKELLHEEEKFRLDPQDGISLTPELQNNSNELTPVTAEVTTQTRSKWRPTSLLQTAKKAIGYAGTAVVSAGTNLKKWKITRQTQPKQRQDLYHLEIRVEEAENVWNGNPSMKRNPSQNSLSSLEQKDKEKEKIQSKEGRQRAIADAEEKKKKRRRKKKKRKKKRKKKKIRKRNFGYERNVSK